MLDLSERSGLPISLDDRGLLVFDSDIVVEDHGERPVTALAPVALEPDQATGSTEVGYYMDNGVYHRRDAERLAGVPMRYELTLIPPRRIGREYIKTFGHRHSPEPKSGLDWAEVCEVLVGTAHFLLQTLDLSGPSASVAYLIEARAGQKVLLPPGYDHCTINPGPEPLLFSDVIARGVSGIYDRFVATRGAVYVEVAEGGQPRLIPNPSYRGAPPLVRVGLKDYPGLDLTSDVPLYTAFVRNRGQNWPFLGDPSRFLPMFPDLEATFQI
jgi:glucose-6-phosphate isomerase, archaeal